MWPFKTKEVALLLATMEALAPTFEGNLGIDVVRKRAGQYFADNPEEARRALVDENRTPREVCLTALVNLVKGYLRSGEERYPFYVGRPLTLVGQQWMGIYHVAMKELVKIAYLSEDDRRLNVTEFDRELSERFS
jgi:hypothetical protein